MTFLSPTMETSITTGKVSLLIVLSPMCFDCSSLVTCRVAVSGVLVLVRRAGAESGVRADTGAGAGAGAGVGVGGVAVRRWWRVGGYGGSGGV